MSFSGIENLRFKPTYNPYTEPSMEIFAYHDGLKKVRKPRFEIVQLLGFRTKVVHAVGSMISRGSV